MAGKKKTTKPDTQEQSKGPVFRDGEEDIAKIDRYAEYLRLQQRADGMTDEQYLQELDKIMEEGDGFDKGESSYSQAGPGSENGEEPVSRVEVRDGLDAEEEQPGQQGAVAGVNGGSVMLNADEVQAAGEGKAPEQGETSPATETELDSDSVEESEEGEGEYEGAPEGLDEEYGDVVTRGTGGAGSGVTGVAAGPGEDEFDEELEPGDVLLDENGNPIVLDESGSVALDENGNPVVLGENDGVSLDENGNPIVLDADGNPVDRNGDEQGLDADGNPVVAASDGQVSGTGRTEEETVETPGPEGEQVAAPEAQVPVSGAGIIVEDDDEMQPGGAGSGGGTHEETMTVGGYVDVHKEEYKSVDFLDEMAVGTGLAASVETQEYIPPKDVTVSVPNAPDNQPQQQPQYERSALAQRVIDIDEARQAQPGPDGVSGPSR